MAALMVKWTIAAVAAMIMRIVIGSVTSAALSVLFGGWFNRHWRRPHDATESVRSQYLNGKHEE